jgi:hypothetical protein
VSVLVSGQQGNLVIPIMIVRLTLEWQNVNAIVIGTIRGRNPIRIAEQSFNVSRIFQILFSQRLIRGSHF